MEPVEQQLHKVGRAKQLDPYADAADRIFRPLFNSTTVKNTLSGVWLRHRLHPLLTDVAIGALGSATAIDFVAPRHRAAARRLLGLGITAALPTAAAGLNDWVDVYEDGRRIGLVHALGNSAALFCYWLSFRGHRRGKGRLWALLGLGTLAVSGYVGAHLSYVLGVGVDHTAFQPRLEDWQDVAGSLDAPEGVLVRATTKDFPIMLVRVDGHPYALADHCSHAGWGLADGKLDGDCVRCPAHGSVFSIVDGAVRRGPAASPQAIYEVREVDGRIQVRSY
jgi:nitrite reductase/ring-hydroxylating ferredoxin subunit